MYLWANIEKLKYHIVFYYDIMIYIYILYIYIYV